MSTNQIVACLPTQHKLAKKKSISLKDLAKMNIIMLKEGSFLRHLIQAKLKTAEVEPNIVLESNQIETIKGLIASGVGTAFLLDFILEDNPGIKALPLSEPLFVDVGLAWKKDRYISKAAQSFINFCKDTLQKNKSAEE